MTWLDTKRGLIAAVGLLAVVTFVASPFLAFAHDHAGQGSNEDCAICAKAFSPLTFTDSHDIQTYPSIEPCAVPANESSKVAEIPSENSVRAPPAA